MSAISRGQAIQSEETSRVASGSPPDLLLLFPPQRRPDRSDLKAAISVIDNLSITAEAADGQWIELLDGGLTFDCSGFAPGPVTPGPEARSWLTRESGNPPGNFETIGIGLGRHIRAGQGMVPILRVLLKVAAALANRLDDCLGVHWLASATIADRAVFGDMTAQFDGTGPMPMALLTATEQNADGATETVGLHYFIGQEVRIEPAATKDRDEAVILAHRIAAQLLHRGKLETTEQTVGPDGTSLSLAPSPDGTLIVVRAG